MGSPNALVLPEHLSPKYRTVIQDGLTLTQNR